MNQITIYGRPIALKRPRFSKDGHVYNSQSHEMLLKFLEVKKQWGSQPLLTEAIHIDIEFLFKVASSYTETKRRALLNSFHVFVPDTDNLIKAALDFMMGVCYNDDKIVASLSARKIWGKEDKTTINIKKL